MPEKRSLTLLKQDPQTSKHEQSMERRKMGHDQRLDLIRNVAGYAFAAAVVAAVPVLYFRGDVALAKDLGGWIGAALVGAGLLSAKKKMDE